MVLGNFFNFFAHDRDMGHDFLRKGLKLLLVAFIAREMHRLAVHDGELWQEAAFLHDAVRADDTGRHDRSAAHRGEQADAGLGLVEFPVLAARALWEEAEHAALPEHIDGRLDGAAVCRAALHGEGMAAADGRAEDRVLEELDFRHVRDGARQERREERRVPVAHVIGCEDDGPFCGQVLLAVRLSAEQQLKDDGKDDAECRVKHRITCTFR